MLLFCANTVVRESAKFELARLMIEEEENRFWWFGNFLARYFRDGYSRHWESSEPGKHSKTNSKLSLRLICRPFLRDLGGFFVLR